METTTTAVALAEGISGIITDMGSVNTWFWSLFKSFFDMIIANPLIAYPVLFAVLAGAIAIVTKVARKFGARGKR